MRDKFKDLPLRSGVGIIVLNEKNKVFVAKRIDNQKDFWQMPQGGVNDGEDFLTAAYRELEEETSIKNVELIKEIEGTLTYELPDNLLGRVNSVYRLLALGLNPVGAIFGGAIVKILDSSFSREFALRFPFLLSGIFMFILFLTAPKLLSQKLIDKTKNIPID